jgi:hypothetical protein
MGVMYTKNKNRNRGGQESYPGGVSKKYIEGGGLDK